MLAPAFNPAESGAAPLVPDVLLLGMRVVLAPPSDAKGWRSVRISGAGQKQISPFK